MVHRELYKIKEELNMDITEKQRKILDAIISYETKYRVSPSIREICTICGLKSPSTVHAHLLTLESKGYLVRYNKQARSFIVMRGA